MPDFPVAVADPEKITAAHVKLLAQWALDLEIQRDALLVGLRQAERLVDCGGVNCGACQQCLTVNQWALQLSVDSLRDSLRQAEERNERLTEALERIASPMYYKRFRPHSPEALKMPFEIARAALAGEEEGK